MARVGQQTRQRLVFEESQAAVAEGGVRQRCTDHLFNSSEKCVCRYGLASQLVECVCVCVRARKEECGGPAEEVAWKQLGGIRLAAGQRRRGQENQKRGGGSGTEKVNGMGTGADSAGGVAARLRCPRLISAAPGSPAFAQVEGNGVCIPSAYAIPLEARQRSEAHPESWKNSLSLHLYYYSFSRNDG